MEAVIELPLRGMPTNETFDGRSLDGVAAAASKTRRGLLAFIRRQISDFEEAEDILQDVYYQLVQNFDPAEPIANITGWLYTVARNKVTDWYRRRATRGIPANLDSVESKTDRGSDADFSYQQNLLWEATMEALDELPENQRDVFIKNEFEGISFREMSEESGIPINTLLSRKRAAVLALREELRDMYEEMDN